MSVHSNRTGSAILDREFLEIRAKLLELAASFDRMERANGEVPEHAVTDSEPRLALIQQGMDILKDDQTDKAARIQLLFSRQYDATWRSDFEAS